MGEHERDWEGAPEEQEDPQAEGGLEPQVSDSDYFRPHLPKDVFGSQVPAAADGADEPATVTADEPPTHPTDPDPTPPASLPPNAFRTLDLPKPDFQTRREIESAIVQLQRTRPVPVPDEQIPVRSPPDPAHSPPAIPVPPLVSDDDEEEWTEWEPTIDLPPSAESTGAARLSEDEDGETSPSRAGVGQPRTTDYLVLHPFPLRGLACVLNFALVLASPWLAATLLAETVYYPALDIVAEVWFPWFGMLPAGIALWLALWITVARRRHWRYEAGYMLIAWVAAGVAVTGAALSVYEEPSLRGRYLLLVWGGLMSLMPLLFSLHVNMDPAWVVGRRRYWSGAAFAFGPTLLTIGVLASAVAAVHGAHREWRQFMDPADEAFCANLFDEGGFRPGTLAMVVLGQRRDSGLAGRAATCVQRLIGQPWNDDRLRRVTALTKAAARSTSDSLGAPWSAIQRNRKLEDEWTRRRAQLETMSAYLADLPLATQKTFESRLRSKGPTRVECANPFRASESALWRAGGHPECGRALSRSARIKQAMSWMKFLGTKEAFTDPRLSDLRGEQARDFRSLLSEVSHTAKGRETRTQDVTLIAPVKDRLDRLMIVRVAPEPDGQKVYLVTYPQEAFGVELLELVRDEWGSGSRLRCTPRAEYRSGPGQYRVYALKDQDDGYVIVRKWVRGKQRREYYQLTLSKKPC